MKQKEKCHHCKIPVYTEEERAIADELKRRANEGDTSAYSELTKLAVSVANEGRFRRETCEKCQGNSTPGA